MMSVIILLVVALLFLIISIFLFLGKGKWLIAGYNILSKEEQKKYELALNNEQKRMEREAEKATAILKKKEEIDNLRNSCESNL